MVLCGVSRRFVPTPESQKRAVSLLRTFLPMSAVAAEFYEDVRFFDPGGNFEPYLVRTVARRWPPRVSAGADCPDTYVKIPTRRKESRGRK
jgi:hypothetical protein